jgi:acetylornithine deacetylase/succinyl-diaminopimelate desuccinylase-like protein
MIGIGRSFVALSGLMAATLAHPVTPVRAQSDPVTPALIQKTAQANFREFFEPLAMPNDAINAQDVRRNADWLEAAFRKRGFVTKQLPNNGKPLVFAEFARKTVGAKTILFYMHFDGQPVIPGQWAQKSPWVAAVKRRNEKGEWEEIAAEKALGEAIDPDWRFFARSSSDDKGPIMMFLTAFDALAAVGAAPAVNVKVLLDSEEEKGSPTIGIVAKENRDLLSADAIVINDGPVHPSNRPTIVFGNRGNTLVRLTVYGPKSPLHSGHFGNYAPNPAQRLAALLASMKDDNGRVTVAGYYDGVKLSAEERRLLAEVPDDAAELRERIGTSTPESVGGNYQEALQYPSLNIRGMASAAIGDKAANIVPSDATAELDLRTTPGADPDYLVNAIEAHVRGRGYHLVEGAPSDEERASYDKIASLTVARGSKAAYTPIDSPLGKWAQDALARTFATASGPAKTVRIRMMGGSVPTDKLVDALGLPFVIVPLVNGDNNQHSFDENLRIGQFFDGTRAFTGMLRAPL